MTTLRNISALAANALLAFAVILPAPMLAADTDIDDSLYINSRNTDDNEPVSNKSKKETKSINTTYVSRNNKVVSIHPDMFKRAMHISVKNIAAGEIALHVFDAGGILVKKYELKPKGHITTEGLKPGKYSYIILLDNEETAKGLFDIR